MNSSAMVNALSRKEFVMAWTIALITAMNTIAQIQSQFHAQKISALMARVSTNTKDVMAKEIALKAKMKLDVVSIKLYEKIFS